MCARQLTVNVNRGTRTACDGGHPRSVVASVVTEDRMPAKKASRRKTFAFWKPVKPAKRRRKISRPPWWKTTPALAGATTCVMLLAVFIAVYQSGEPRPVSTAHIATAPPMSQVEPSTVAPIAPPPQPAPAEPTAATVTPNRVTITGCLERADEAFRLKDTDGEAAPKTRSWKSAFLKKGRAAVDVVDDGNRLNLSNHVGERVVVTGTLVDREIRVRTIERVAASCTIAPRVKV
jgi:hypothetical protein